MPTEANLLHYVHSDWLAGAPLNEFIGPYIAALETWRYSENTRSGYLRCLAHFNYWMQKEGLTTASIDPALIKRFL